MKSNYLVAAIIAVATSTSLVPVRAGEEASAEAAASSVDDS